MDGLRKLPNQRPGVIPRPPVTNQEREAQYDQYAEGRRTRLEQARRQEEAAQRAALEQAEANRRATEEQARLEAEEAARRASLEQPVEQPGEEIPSLPETVPPVTPKAPGGEVEKPSVPEAPVSPEEGEAVAQKAAAAGDFASAMEQHGRAQEEHLVQGGQDAKQ